jgi:hypothetical protein
MKPKAPVKSPKSKAAAAAQKRLIKLKSVAIEDLPDNQCRISVQLNCNRKTITGERTGPNEPDYKIMLAALSTLEALMIATDQRMKMELLFIERQKVAAVDREVIMVLIDVNVGTDTRAATGACQLRGDVAETAVRAVLDATNRIVELYFDSLE